MVEILQAALNRSSLFCMDQLKMKSRSTYFCSDVRVQSRGHVFVVKLACIFSIKRARVQSRGHVFPASLFGQGGMYLFSQEGMYFQFRGQGMHFQSREHVFSVKRACIFSQEGRACIFSQEGMYFHSRGHVFRVIVCCEFGW